MGGKPWLDSTPQPHWGLRKHSHDWMLQWVVASWSLSQPFFKFKSLANLNANNYPIWTSVFCLFSECFSGIHDSVRAHSEHASKQKGCLSPRIEERTHLEPKILKGGQMLYFYVGGQIPSRTGG